MKVGKLIILLISIALIFVIIYKEVTKPSAGPTKGISITKINGEYNNHQQYWMEKSINAQKKHDHFHIQFDTIEGNKNARIMKIFHEKENSKPIASQTLEIKKNEKGILELILDGKNNSTLSKTSNGFKSEDGFLQLSGDTLRLSQIAGIGNPSPFIFIKCRYFSGSLEYSSPSKPDSLISLKNLKLHDQGDKTKFYIDKKEHTIQLSQISSDNKKSRMNMAIYKLPMDSLSSGSTPLSESWTSPKATQIGLHTKNLKSEWSLVGKKKK